MTGLGGHRLYYALGKAILDFNPIWGHVGFGGAIGGSSASFLALQTLDTDIQSILVVSIVSLYV